MKKSEEDTTTSVVLRCVGGGRQKNTKRPDTLVVTIPKVALDQLGWHERDTIALRVVADKEIPVVQLCRLRDVNWPEVKEPA